MTLDSHNARFCRGFDSNEAEFRLTATAIQWRIRISRMPAGRPDTPSDTGVLENAGPPGDRVTGRKRTAAGRAFWSRIVTAEIARILKSFSTRRDGRAVDGGGLENHCSRKVTGGSNPSPSANLLRSRLNSARASAGWRRHDEVPPERVEMRPREGGPQTCH